MPPMVLCLIYEMKTNVFKSMNKAMIIQRESLSYPSSTTITQTNPVSFKDKSGISITENVSEHCLIIGKQ